LRFVPIQLETLHARRNPYLPHWRVRAHHELRRRIFKLDSKRALIVIDVELMVVGRPFKSTLQAR
jgi:hypothetical protein